MNQEAVRGVRDPSLRALLHEHWEHTLRTAPTWATRLGDHRYDDQLGVWGPAEVEEAARLRKAWLDRAQAIDAAGLDAADRLTHALFVDVLAEAEAGEVCHSAWWGLSARSNPLATANDLPDVAPILTLKDGKNLASRYRGIPAMVAGWQANLRLGVAHGYTPEIEATRLVLTQVRDELARPDAELALWAPIAAEHPGWEPADVEAHRTELKLALRDARAAFAAFADFVERELLPVARPPEKAGLLHLPEGGACYAALIRQETSLRMSAAEIHQVGLDALARTHAQMVEIGARRFGLQDRRKLFDHLRDDPSLRYRDGAEILAEAQDRLARAKEALPRLLGRLPQADCVVKPIPDYLAPYTYIAYYNPSVPGEQPGEYRVNLHEPTTRRRFEAAALSFHESVPGHHVQIALAQELEELPAFRRHMGWTSFVEGWALYAESLADEVGLYDDDLDQLGRYGFDTWRSSRLVVDTGIHAFGWDRERAVQFMLENTPLAENNIRNEVDRYITWPGQALAYKLGQLEILRLRAQAEARLGERFDLRAFNDLLLGAGAINLPTLQARVDAWVASR